MVFQMAEPAHRRAIRSWGRVSGGLGQGNIKDGIQGRRCIVGGAVIINTTSPCSFIGISPCGRGPGDIDIIGEIEALGHGGIQGGFVFNDNGAAVGKIKTTI